MGMATTGYIVQSFLRWPGYLSTSAGVKFADLPNGILALKSVPPLGLFQILAFIGLMETQTWRFLDGTWPGEVPKDKARVTWRATSGCGTPTQRRRRTS